MSFLGITPAEIAGFVSAQNELRETAGVVASFGVPTTPQWPEGTAINPDTGEPFDATLVQANDEFEWTDLTVLVIEKLGTPGRSQADINFTESGMREGMDITLDVSTADYETTVVNATTFRVLSIDYQLEEARPYAMGGTTYRYLVYGGAK